jgi:hypothetical protein
MTDRPLNLIEAFGKPSRAAEAFGYMKVDDTTVLERKKIPIGEQLNHSGYNTISTIWTTVYDFKSQHVLTFTHTNSSADTQPVIKSFNQIGEEALLDAHRALLELGGNPSPLSLDNANAFAQGTRRDLPARKPLELSS